MISEDSSKTNNVDCTLRKTEGWKIKEGQHGKEAVVLGRDQGTILQQSALVLIPIAD